MLLLLLVLLVMVVLLLLMLLMVVVCWEEGRHGVIRRQREAKNQSVIDVPLFFLSVFESAFVRWLDLKPKKMFRMGGVLLLLLCVLCEAQKGWRAGGSGEGASFGSFGFVLFLLRKKTRGCHIKKKILIPYKRDK
jgi:hypothetical protein